jgi:hypothetical protein
MGEERMQKEMSAPLRRAPRRLRRDAFRLAQPAEPSQLLLRGARSVPRDRDLFSELLRLRLRLLRASLRVGGGRAADGRLDFASSRAFQSHSRVGELGVEPLRARDSLVGLPRGRARGLLERGGRSLLRRELVAERRERGLGGGGASDAASSFAAAAVAAASRIDVVTASFVSAAFALAVASDVAFSAAATRSRRDVSSASASDVAFSAAAAFAASPSVFWDPSSCFLSCSRSAWMAFPFFTAPWSFTR